MDFQDLNLTKVHSEHNTKPFDCEDDDLNDFLFHKAIGYHNELLVTTFVFENETETIAYYSIFTDSLKVEADDFASKSSFRRFLRNLVSHPKRHLEYSPALKIGRLAVSKSVKRKGYGKLIVNSIISNALDLNEKLGCKLVTVDAYKQSLKFYEKLGFEYLSHKDEGEDTRQMYCDLTPLIS